MKNEMTIIETKNSKSITGSFFEIYINGVFVAMQTTREAAEAKAKKILEKKVYRS